MSLGRRLRLCHRSFDGGADRDRWLAFICRRIVRTDFRRRGPVRPSSPMWRISG
ncbi:MAG: hypothetical protein M0C28_42080 [Candidatus Moduliflexus flocculans]|nr:hypothetical protein [Candidatus Moduliflexus flocculans]